MREFSPPTPLTSPRDPLKERAYPDAERFAKAKNCRIPCPDGGIGRRTSFRCWRSQGRGGSSPLLGTSYSQNTEILGKSSQRRSSKRVCYEKLLRFGADSSDIKSGKTIKNGPRGFYGFSHGLLPKNMILRGGRFYIRRHVPVDIQAFIGRLEIWRSLKTDSLQLALRRMPIVCADIEREFERIRSMSGQSIDATLLPPSFDDQGRGLEPDAMKGSAEAPRLAEAVTLGAAYTRYMDDPSKRWSVSTRQAYETSRKLALAVIGDDVPIAAIARIHCRQLFDVLRYLPRNASKHFPKLTLLEAAQRSKRVGNIELISPAHANVNLANFSSFLNWAVNEELLVRNPMRGLRFHDDVAKRDKRLPFSRSQLEAIFNAPLYRGCLDGERGYAKIGQERPRNARFWVPLIALHTGMRLNEICQLDIADIRDVENIPCFVVSEASMVGSQDKQLKTAASERMVPIHRTLLNCGLVAYAEQRRRRGWVKLFEDIDEGPRGKRAVAFSKWFTQFSRACGAYQARTSFHSFRHNFRDELRAARVDHDIAMVLGGWTKGANSNNASENYGSGYRVALLSEAIERLAFNEIDLTHLAYDAR